MGEFSPSLLNSLPDGITWTARTSLASPLWESVTFDNGLFVAVAPNRVMTSPNGITWTLRTPASGNNWYGVTYGNGLFVAVSTNGTNRVMTSPNGITWTSRTAAAANSWQKITFGNGLFVAVSADGTNRVMTSADGITWTSRNASVNNGWRAVVYGYDFLGNSQFVALAGDGVGNRVMSSTNGINWTTRASTSDIDWKGLGYGNGRFVAVAYSQIGIMTSDFAIPEINLQGNNVSIADGDVTPSTADNTNFGVTGTGGTIIRTFTIQNTGTDILNITSIVSNNTKFVVSGAPTTVAASSSATFVVTYTPTGITTDNATITVNNNDNDEAVYDFAITGRQISTLPTSVRGNMMSFNNNHVSVPNNAAFQFADGTIEFWVKPTFSTSPGYNPCLISNRNGGGAAGTRYSYHMQGGKTGIDLYNGSGVTGWASTFNTNQWYHIAIVESGTTVEVFVNGISLGTRTTGSSAVTGVPFNIGSAGGANIEPFVGNIDEVRVWNIARTQAQIRENMHLTLAGTETGLVAYYQFNETSGVAIEAINGNNGTLQNGATRIVSEVAVAQGTSDRRTVSASLVNFTNANVAVNFTTAPADEFVAYQLRGNPFNGVGQLNPGTNTSSCYWIIRKFGAGAVGYDGMNFTLPSNNIISPADVGTPNNLKLHKRNDDATSAFPGSFASATNANNTTKVIQFTGFPFQNSFSQFEISSSFSPLPITLLSFGGKRTDESNVLLEWKTVSELNNEGFDIEISKNVTDFTKIGFVDGKGNAEGNTNDINNYEFNLKNNDDMYYRLKQRDFEGKSSYSNIIFVKGNESFIKIYPNPTTKNLYIDLNNWKNSDGTYFKLFDFQGKFIVGDNIKSNKTTLNIENLQKGMYLLQIIENKKRATHKIVVY